MAELEKIRRTIESAEDLQSVVRTMKSMAAVTSRQFEKAVESLHGYNRTVELALQILVRDPAFAASSATSVEGERVGAIVFGSDQGMVGRFNEEVAEFAHAKLSEFDGSPDERLIATLGERPVGSLADLGYSVEAVVSVPTTPDGVTDTVGEFLRTIEAWRAEQGVGRVLLFGNEPAKAASYDPAVRQMLPLDGEWLREVRGRDWSTNNLPQFSMSPGALLRALVRQFLFVSLFRGCAFSISAENSARMAAMQSAEKNIDERLGGLNGEFRHERQRAITEELLDIVSGFEALTSK